MKRTLLVAGHIAVLFGASVAIILALRRSPPAPATPDPSPPSPTIAVAPAPPGPVAAEPFKGGKLYLPATGPGLRPDGERRAETSMPTVDRVTRKAVRKALQAASLQSRLARCVDRDREVGFGGGASPARVPRPRAATLVLEIETGTREVRIVEAKVQSFGGASEAAVSCARNVLSGKVLAAKNAKPGKHVQMPFPLNPRSPALAAAR